MVSEKGQSSPFELLITLVLLGFVLVVGVQAMAFFFSENCKTGIRSTAFELKAVLEDVASGNSRNLFFDPPQCFTKAENVPEMRLEKVSDERQCSLLCGMQKSECLAFAYDSIEFSYSLCLQGLGAQSMFPEGAPCSVPSEKFVATDLKKEIPRGSFEFVNKSAFAGNATTVCAFLAAEKKPIVGKERRFEGLLLDISRTLFGDAATESPVLLLLLIVLCILAAVLFFKKSELLFSSEIVPSSVRQRQRLFRFLLAISFFVFPLAISRLLGIVFGFVAVFVEFVLVLLFAYFEKNLVALEKSIPIKVEK